MKKLLTLILVTFISVTFISCDLENSRTSSSDTSTTSTISSTLSDTTTTTTTTSTNTTSATTTNTTTTTTTTTEDPYNRYQVIDLYSVNDFHGGAYNGIDTLSQIAGFMEYRKSVNQNTVFLTNGDIFQGAALSNYYRGRPIVDAFNIMELDGFVLGNHEFDWGIDEVLKYRDGDLTNGEMQYPILAANIVYKDTQELLVNTVPYIIKELSGVRIGVIGLIDELENSISASKLENIEFTSPYLATEKYAKELRTTQECDIVVVYIHGSSEFYNYDVAHLSGDYYIDAVFNGHTHRNEMGAINTYDRTSGVPMFHAQANNYYGSYHSYIAHISLEYDREEKKVVYQSYNIFGDDPNISKALNYTGHDLLGYSNQEVEAILDDYEFRTEYSSFVSEVLTTTENNLQPYQLVTWGANVIRDHLDIDFGVLNQGGFRVALDAGDITVGEMMEVYPFDNFIKTCEMTGAEIRELYNDFYYSSYDVVFDDSLEKQNNVLLVNGVSINDNQIYTIGAVDYVFDKEDYGFLEGNNIQNTGVLMRDLLLDDLRSVPMGEFFDPSNGPYKQNLTVIYDPNIYKELKKILFI